MRNLDTGTKDAFISDGLMPVIFAELEFENGTEHVWSGVGDYSWDGNTWEGLGHFAGISEIQESADLRANGVTLSLSGVPSSLIALAIGELRQGKVANIWLGAIDEDGVLEGEPYGVFKGKMDVATIEDSGDTASISVNVENNLLAVERPRLRRFTDEDQKIDHPTDRGLEYVAELWSRFRLLFADSTRPPTDNGRP